MGMRIWMYAIGVGCGGFVGGGARVGMRMALGCLAISHLTGCGVAGLQEMAERHRDEWVIERGVGVVSPASVVASGVGGDVAAGDGGSSLFVHHELVVEDDSDSAMNLDLAISGPAMSILRALVLAIPDWNVVVSGRAVGDMSVDVQLRSRADLWALIARLGCTVQKLESWYDVRCGAGGRSEDLTSGEDGEARRRGGSGAPIGSRIIVRLGPWHRRWSLVWVRHMAFSAMYWGRR